MRFSLTVLASLALACSAALVAADNACDECPSFTFLMCGADGVTYGNPCAAECRNVAIAHNGPCASTVNAAAAAADVVVIPPNCETEKCAYTVDVCGADGMTYKNPCEPKCKGVSVAHYGACLSTHNEDTVCDDCPTFTLLTCGADGVTYGNPCAAECRNVAIAYDGPCQATTTATELSVLGKNVCDQCPSFSLLVCGADGVTYANACYATCRNVELSHEGPCN